MENINLFISIAIMAPLFLMLLFLRGRTQRVLAFAILGIYICLLSGEIDALIFDVSVFSEAFFTENVSPIVEETLKAIPIFVYVFAFKPNKQSIVECALALGVGFAIMENVLVLVGSTDNISLIFVIFRGFGAGMMHGVTTLMIGIGLEIVSRKKRLIIPGTLASLSAACIFHSIYNIIIHSQYQYFGIVLPLLTFVYIA